MSGDEFVAVPSYFLVEVYALWELNDDEWFHLLGFLVGWCDIMCHWSVNECGDYVPCVLITNYCGVFSVSLLI